MGSTKVRSRSSLACVKCAFPTARIVLRLRKLKLALFNRLIQCLQWNNFLLNPPRRCVDVHLQLGRTNLVDRRNPHLPLERTRHPLPGCARESSRTQRLPRVVVGNKFIARDCDCVFSWELYYFTNTFVYLDGVFPEIFIPGCLARFGSYPC